ncbi:MAG: hypothetical protein R3D66_00350 [Alphaproteobacteria bacterium]
MMTPLFSPEDIKKAAKELYRQFERVANVPYSVWKEGQSLQVTFGNEALGRQPDPEVRFILKKMIEQDKKDLELYDILKGTRIPAFFAYKRILPDLRDRGWVQEFNEQVTIAGTEVCKRTYTVQPGIDIRIIAAPGDPS